MPIYHCLHLSLLQPVKYLEALPAICFLPPRVVQFSMITLSLSHTHTYKSLYFCDLQELFLKRAMNSEPACAACHLLGLIKFTVACLHLLRVTPKSIFPTLSLWTGNIKASQLKRQEFTKLFPERSGLPLPQKAVTTITKPINNN